MSTRPSGARRDASLWSGLRARAAAWLDERKRARKRREANAAAMPKRPALSPLLPGVAAVWGTILLVNAAVLDRRAGLAWLDADPRLVLCLGLVVACLVVVVAGVACAAVRPACLVVAAGVLCGAAAGLLAIQSTLQRGDTLVTCPVSSYTFLVETDPQVNSLGTWRFEAAVVDASGTASATRVWVDVGCSVKLLNDGAPSLPGMGSLVSLVGRWDAFDLANEFDRSLVARGVAARLTALRIEGVGFQTGPVGWVRQARCGMLATLEPYRDECRALTAGTVCGMQAALAAFDTSDAFAELGLSHLVAVSGSHLAVVALVAGSVASRARVRPRAKTLLLAVLLGLYVAFTGFQMSAVRSWVMAVLALAATVAGRRGHAVSAVCVAAFVLLLFDPRVAANLGFSLSVLSVVGLTVFARLAGSWCACILSARTPRSAVDAVSLTLVSQTFTLPVTLPAFGGVALYAPLANVVVGPLVSGLLLVGLAAVPLAAAVPSLAAVALVPCDVFAGISCAAARFMARLPGTTFFAETSGAVLFVLLVGGALVLYATWPRPSRVVALGGILVALLVAACVYVPARFFAPARLVVLDVGQGDAILVQEGGRTLLIDTGPDDAVVYALARQRVYHLDAVMLTHTDADHAGGLDELAEAVPIGQVMVAEGVVEALEAEDATLDDVFEMVVGADVVELGAGDIVTVGGFELSVLWPQGPVTGAENEDSLVCALSYDCDGRTLTALLTGDAESGVIEPLLRAHAVGEVDVLKLGHHGSAVSTTETMIEVLSPLVAVASAGEGNRYGHPTDAAVAAAMSNGAAFHCTATCGDVDLRPAQGGVEVRCAYEGDSHEGVP